MRKFVVSLLLPLYAWAGPPMNSNDPFVPNLGQYEINLALSREFRDTSLTQFPFIDANYGLAKNLEVTLATAYTYEADNHDYDALEIAMKWLVYNDNFFAMALAVAYISFPLDSIYHTGETNTLSVPMNFTFTQNVSLVVDIIYVNPKNEAEHFEMGTYIQYSQNNHTYFLEGYSDEISSQSTIPLLGSVGYSYNISKTKSFLFSYGEELVTQTTKAKTFYSALQLLF